MKTRTGTLLTAAALSAVAMSALVTGCELIASVDRSIIEGSGGGSTGTGGTGGSLTTSTSSTGGGGGTSTSTGGVACVDPAKDCPAPPNECVTAICDANKLCAVSNVAADTVTTTQTAGDCKKVVCDGNGATKAIDDNADINDDTKECTVDTCAAGVPANTPKPVSTACGAPGGTTKCDAAGDCVGCIDITDCGTPPACKVNTCTAGKCGVADAAEASACDDGNKCTQSDSCQAGACVGSNPVVCTALDQCHDAGVCAQATGVCSPSLPKGDGSACDDNNACTQTDSCTAGICTGSSPIVCPAPDQCHDMGTCSPTTGLCDNPTKTNGTPCMDTSFCTQTDTCQAGVCTGSNPVVCVAADECHNVGTCQLATGLCSLPTKADGTPCGPGGTKMCMTGVCQ